MIPSLALIAVVIVAAVVGGRAIWPTHLSMPPARVPASPDRSTGRWLRECEQILAAGTGRHRAPTRILGRTR